MIEGMAPDAAAALAAIEYSPIAIVANAYRRSDVAHSLAGFGFLVPKREHRFILGCLFSSSMFDGRAPEGSVLLTTFAGGRRNPGIAATSDAEISASVRDELAARLGARGAPLWQEVVRWTQAIPQYDIGHLDRIRRIEAAEVRGAGTLVLCELPRGRVGGRSHQGRAGHGRAGRCIHRRVARRATRWTVRSVVARGLLPAGLICRCSAT